MLDWTEKWKRIKLQVNLILIKINCSHKMRWKTPLKGAKMRAFYNI
jgi:hypothetical protein